MSDDLETVNIRRTERGREIEILRQQYRHHRDHLEKMMADAPTEHLANEYQRLIRSIDGSLLKLDELEGRGPVAPAAAAGAAAAAIPAATRAAARPPLTPPPPAAERDAHLGMRQLQPNPDEADDLDETEIQYDTEAGRRGTRTILILLVALIAIIVIGWLVWRSTSEPAETLTPVAETQTATPAEPDTATVEPSAAPAAASALSVAPESQNYGLIRKGTRATRQFEIANTGGEPMTVKVSRSECRCLFYEYVDTIAPKSKEMLTVTVDGNRAKAGELRETITVASTNDPKKTATFQIVANVQ